MNSDLYRFLIQEAQSNAIGVVVPEEWHVEIVMVKDGLDAWIVTEMGGCMIQEDTENDAFTVIIRNMVMVNWTVRNAKVGEVIYIFISVLSVVWLYLIHGVIDNGPIFYGEKTTFTQLVSS